MSSEKIAAFIRRRALSMGQGLERFSLIHAQAEGPGSVLLTTTRQPEQADLEQEIQSITRELFEHALEHVETCNRSQRYAVIAYGKNDEVAGQIPFKLSPTPDKTDLRDSEPATPTGALSLSMRLTESFARMNMSGFSDMLRGAIEENERLRRRVGELESKLIASFNEREELASQRHERDLEMLEADRKEKRKDLLVEQVVRVLPVVLPKALSSMFPQLEAKKPENGKRPIAEFMSSLTPEQVAEITSKLTDEQQTMLMTIVGSENEAIENSKGAS